MLRVDAGSCPSCSRGIPRRRSVQRSADTGVWFLNHAGRPGPAIDHAEPIKELF
jgi:hypothetical protein